MAYYSQSTIAKAKEMDLLTYLQTYEPNELVKISGNTYTTKTHDSLKISNGMWMWWSRGIGGKSAVDYLMRVRGMTFIEAVSQIANDESALRKQYEKPKPRTERTLILPTKAENNDIAIEYLKKRGINEDVIFYFIEHGMIYQSVPMNNIVFVGFDENNIPKYAGMRGTEKYRYIGDAYGSDKTFPFRLTNKDNTKKSNKPIKVFEIKDKDLKKFCQEAKKYGVMYHVLKDRDKNDGKCDIMVRAEDSAKVNRIFQRFNLGANNKATVRASLEKSKGDIKQSPEKQKPEKSAEDKFIDELFAKPQQTEKSYTENPSMAKTEKSRPSEPSYEVSELRHHTRDNKSSRPSVRAELNRIKEERKNVATAKYTPQKTKSKTKGTKTNGRTR